jgi:hypothetical protein
MAVIDLKAINMTDLRNFCTAFNATGLLPSPIEVRVGVRKEDMANAFVKGIETCNDIGKLDDLPDDVYTYYTTIVKPGTPQEGQNQQAAPAAQPAAQPAQPPQALEDYNAGMQAAIMECKNKAQVIEAASNIASANGIPVPKLAKSWTVAKMQEEAIKGLTIECQAPAQPAAQPAAPAAQPAAPAARGPVNKPKAPATPKAPAAPKAPRQTRATVFASICQSLVGQPVTKETLRQQMDAQYKGSAKETNFWVSGYTALLVATGHMTKNGDTFTYTG